MNEFFHKISARISGLMGTPMAFMVAIVIVILWALTGPGFGYSDTWQLVINTGTTIANFLMVFLIQNTLNRDSKAIHLKLDELLKSVKGARTQLVDIEEMSDKELTELQDEFHLMREKYSAALAKKEEKKNGKQ